MNGRENPRAHEEGPKKRERKGDDRKEHRPDLEAPTLFRHGKAVHQRSTGQPRHKGAVFHRIPEPPAAPAEFVVGPVGTQTDAEREKNPRRRRPRTHPARPGHIELTADQGCEREGKGHGKAHVAQIQKRRMKDHPRVLQQGI